MAEDRHLWRLGVDERLLVPLQQGGVNEACWVVLFHVTLDEIMKELQIRGMIFIISSQIYAGKMKYPEILRYM